MENIINRFKKECKVVDFKYEYPGYAGDVRYGIITSLTEEELEEKYFSIVCKYKPYIILGSEIGDVRADFVRNENKHLMRRIRSESCYGYEENIGCFHSEIFSASAEDITFEEMDIRKLHKAILMLSPIQSERIIKYYFIGKTAPQIAEEEGVAHQVVYRSIKRGMKKLKELLS
ncbi:MAG: sigma-70 family RNA polymerase sigma factor [Firmicutes bacterium]|nr:sigma-70 family RNA polymerase sigma factor [Bacillota bacterium]